MYPGIPKESVFNVARKVGQGEVPQTPTPVTSPFPVSANGMILVSLEYMLLLSGVLMGVLGLTALWIMLRGL